jgi:hypothetical protein
MESVKFERADIPGYAEARLFSDRQSTSNNLAIREKYNATISMIGNTVFLPGSQLNLLPEPLDLGFAEEEGSIARSLGLGGVFVVHRIENQIDMARGSWDTQLITKWESSGEEVQTDEATDVEQYCADLAAAAAETRVFTTRTSMGAAACFAAGTKISMHDGTMKNIEDIVIGDTVLSWDEKTNEITRGNVSGLNQPLHDDMVNLTWGSITNKNTFDHPFYVKDKGWCSYAPDLTMERYSLFETVEKLETGDICYYNSGIELKEIRLSSIEEEIGITQTYIFSVETYNTFFANNILTHNKRM